VAPVIPEALPGWRRLLRGEQDEANLPWHVVTVLRDAGVTPETPVGILGNAQVASRWARLGRIRIVAELPAAQTWQIAADSDMLRSIVEAFRQTPVRVLLAEQVPPAAAAAGWRQVQTTPYWMLRLPEGSDKPDEVSAGSCRW
jgi:hypothetical protein